ncbi:ADP/ATP-dependent (S)-NAD(P)H-hydrate dehydratase [Rothia sp. LK2588]|uniref:NAD(P)H-hydrate dehydratase n=1 Tax=Rothia sp. LK2588 TaxID=3114369 RepID=UPI0034CE7F03
MEPTEFTETRLRVALCPPQAADHKYTRGVLGVVCGSTTYPGAAMLATRAAIETGCGMVRSVGPEELSFYVRLHAPEAVCSDEPLEHLHVQAWAAGSGAVGENREAHLAHVVAAREPAVLDAAALDIAARSVGLNGPLGAHKILTPHAGELQTVLQWLHALLPDRFASSAERWGVEEGAQDSPTRQLIEENPTAWAGVAAELTGATVLLKGGTTVVASAEGELLSVAGRTGWLATAGSGDTLTGIMGSLLAQRAARAEAEEERLSPRDVAEIAAAAAELHQRAALAVHGGCPTGPVPGTAVARHIAPTIAKLLNNE